MAKFLIRHTPNPGEKTEEGDFIIAVNDNHVFGRNEDIRVWVAEFGTEEGFPDTFSVLEVPGMPLISAQRGLERWYRIAIEGDPEFNYPPPDNIHELGPRRWQLGKQSHLPPNLSNKLDRDRFLIVTYDAAAINSYVIDRAGLDVLITDTPIDPV